MWTFISKQECVESMCQFRREGECECAHGGQIQVRVSVRVRVRVRVSASASASASVSASARPEEVVDRRLFRVGQQLGLVLLVVWW